MSDETTAKQYVSISVEQTYNLDVFDLWPDGDAPDEITPEAVASLMHRDGMSIGSVLRRWNMDDLDAWVTAGGKTVQVYRDGRAIRVDAESEPTP